MKCEEVQAQLTEYLERTLGIEALAPIEEHLADCTRCRVETELLGECIRQVAALPIIEPPPGFVQRVMVRVRETEARPGIWQWLMLPLRVKIPIQATAVLMVGILGIYLLQKEEPHKQSKTGLETKAADTVIDKSAPATKSENTVLAKRADDQPVKALQEQFAPSSLPPPQTTPSRNRTSTAENQAPKNSPPTPAASSDATRATSVTNLSQERRGGSLRPAPEPGGNTGAAISGTPVANNSSSQLGGSPFTFSFPFESDSGAALRSMSPAIEPFADYELVLRRHRHEAVEPLGAVGAPKQRLEASRKISEPASTPRAIERLMTAIPDHTRPQTIWIIVPRNQYENFKSELQQLGTIESEARVPLWRDSAPSQSDGQLRVKLTALPTTDSPAADKPSGQQR